MDNNQFMIYDDFLYSLYTAEDEERRIRDLLLYLRMLIPSSYASLLTSDPDLEEPNFTGVYCDPIRFTPAEERYVGMYRQDPILWNLYSKASVVLKESDLLNDEQRLSDVIYRECYRVWQVYDTVQLSIVYRRKFFGVVTLFHTREDPPFSEDDIALLKSLSRHLNYAFSRPAPGSSSLEIPAVDLTKIPEGEHLTPRENEILGLIYRMKTNQEICEQLRITDNTLQKHLQNIYRKLNISSRLELFRFRL